jgi:lipid-binding SYLF domain-containing protein
MTRERATKWLASLAVAATLAMASGVDAADRGDALGIVEDATQSVQAFRGGDHGATVNALLGAAKGVIIYPHILKAAFLVGGEGGTGVMLGRDAAGHWSPPAFVTFAAASYGLQVGAESSQVMLIIMNEKTLERAVGGGLELGSNATIAAGDQGMKGQVLSTDQLQDIHYFAMTQGLFAGFDLKGATTLPRDALNEAYYGKPVTAADAVLQRTVGADGPAEALAEALGH